MIKFLSIPNPDKLLSIVDGSRGNVYLRLPDGNLVSFSEPWFPEKTAYSSVFPTRMTSPPSSAIWWRPRDNQPNIRHPCPHCGRGTALMK